MSLDAILTDSLVAIGAPGKASLPSFGEDSLTWPFSDEEVDDIEVFSASDAYLPNLEELVQVAPGQIVTLSWVQDELASPLQEIAPVVAFDDTFPWRQNTMRLAEEIFGSSERGEKVLEEFDAEVKRVAVKMPEAKTVGLLRVQPDGRLMTYHASSAPGALLQELGLAVLPFPEGAEDPNGDESVAQISGELLGDLDVDVLFVATPAPEQGVPSALTGSPLWGGLPVVQAGDAHVVATAGWTTNGPLGWRRGLLSDIEEFLG